MSKQTGRGCPPNGAAGQGGAALTDAAARQLIEERLDLNVLVEAGAGSGKTHSLAARMAAGIVTGQYRVHEIAAVTFTRKAAAELRGRFQLALEHKLSDERGERRARIEAALAGLEHLFAGTIHSFCAHLLRERPVEANIAPGFTELEELEDADLRQRAWRDHLSRLRGEDSPLLQALQEARVAARDLDAAFATVCTFDEVDFPAGDAPAPDVRTARRAAEAFWRRVQELMPQPVPPGAKCEALKRAAKFRGLMRAAKGGGAAGLVEALRCWEKLPPVTMKWWADGLAGQREVRAKVAREMERFHDATVVPFLSAWRQYLYRLVMTLLTDAREAAREQRRRELALNYGDLLTASASLLRGNAAVRAALQRKYRWLLVDEFQDTDPIQAEVMLLLAAEEDGTQAALSDPYAVRLRPGALFVVGDPKQSIYRFRRADIDVYNRVREVIRANGGEVVRLTTSFRASPSLCQWNNEVFSRLLPAAPTVHQAAFSLLDADPGWKPRQAKKAESTGLRTLDIPGEVDKGRVVGWEAEAIARFIRAEVDAKRAGWHDFLVLARKKKNLGAYAAALQAWQVPVDVSGAGAFGGSALVLALVDLLRALGDPSDGPAVVGVLRGPLFGISDSGLFEHRQGGRFFTFTAARGGSNGEPPRGGAATAVDKALDRLGGYLRLVRTLPLAAAVERILDDSGFLALAACDADGGAGAGDLLHAVDLVRAAAADGGGVADAARALEQAAESPDIESVPLQPGRRDVVRVMNLHRAKGLESRVVFLADPLGGTKTDVQVRVVREGGLAHGYLAISKEVGDWGRQLIAHPAGWEGHVEAERAYVEAEETRLLYVAATRAREMLVVSRWEGQGAAKRPWAALEPHLSEAVAIDVASLEPLLPGGGRSASGRSRAEAQAARARRSEIACKPSWRVTSVTAAAGEGQPQGPGEGETPSARDAGQRVDAGAAWGSLLHSLLEHAGRHAHATRAALERLAAWRAVDSPDLQPLVPAAVDLAERVLNAPFWEEVRAGGRVEVEVPLAVAVPAGEPFGLLPPSDVPTILRGVIDLVYRAADGWRIVDYKTDVAAEGGASLLARHEAQLSLYGLAWERATAGSGAGVPAGQATAGSGAGVPAGQTVGSGAGVPAGQAGERVAGRGIVSVRTGRIEWT